MDASEKLNVALIQSDLVWEDKNANLKRFSATINSIEKNTDLIVLPEMFTTGFTMNTEKLAEEMDGETVNWMQKLASQKQTAIAGSIIIAENNQYYNRFLFVRPSGKVNSYDKLHLL